MKCETCKFWDGYEWPLQDGEEPSGLAADDGYGTCKRYPPVLRRPLRDDEDAAETSEIVRPIMFWEQPFTTGTDWCGEWKSRNVPSAGKCHIIDLPLSLRVRKCLLAEGIETLEQLSMMSDQDLMRLPCMGRRAVAEIRDVLNAKRA